MAAGSERATAPLLTAADAGGVRAIARLLSRIEAGGDGAAEIALALAGRPRRAVIVGLTGPPGVGKSTLTTALVARHRQAGRRVAVLAVDPSSPFSGGALLGDRVRMSEHTTDPGVYIRSMSSRGELGGLAAAAPAAVDLFSAIGFDVVLVETVGVGQNEVAVMRLADSVVVVLAPGMGDGIQAAKAGILEIADVLVVNKSDHDGAASTVRELRAMVALGRAGVADPGQWRVPVLSTVAIRRNGSPEQDSGIDGLLAALASHHQQLIERGEAVNRRRQRAEVAVRAVVLERIHRQLSSVGGQRLLTRAGETVANGESDPHRAAALVLDSLTGAG